jgi:hypothetical protein
MRIRTKILATISIAVPLAAGVAVPLAATAAPSAPLASAATANYVYRT